mmetsp:Transcript_1929/g.3416  ORF Transcript_1929/g.3416 Transcript_1929/m.3416 type:complete len:84 (-) Transcript_1929:873-1124(-)
MFLVLIIAHLSQAFLAFREALLIFFFTLLSMNRKRPLEKLLTADVTRNTKWRWHFATIYFLTNSSYFFLVTVTFLSPHHIYIV